MGGVISNLTSTAYPNGVKLQAQLSAVLKLINKAPMIEVVDFLPWKMDLNQAEYAEPVKVVHVGCILQIGCSRSANNGAVVILRSSATQAAS